MLKDFDFTKERYERQLEWYDSKSVSCKRNHDILQGVVIVCSTLTPIFILVLAPDWNLLAVVTSAVVSAAASAMAAFKIREKWISYRTTAEAMRAEYSMYKTGSGPYSDGGGQQAFVERIESLISHEVGTWRAVHKKK